jgi:predicted nucleotide-binding protein (sugar kinase/HSP70/actin superfamily)
MGSSTLGYPDMLRPVPHPPRGESRTGADQRQAGRSSTRGRHFRRPSERPFLSSERDGTTILLGGLTLRHEHFIKAVFEGSGYRCEILPSPDQDAFQVGKEFGNNGQCSPAYFTAGSLIKFLKELEAGGMSRGEIADRYVFFTAGSCGPCRFGMYAAEYRMSLQNAGFEGFRVIRFQQDDGIKQKIEEPGLKYTLDFGLGMLKSVLLGDVLNDLVASIRPFEVVPGETDRVMDECLKDLQDHLRTYRPEDIDGKIPSWIPKGLFQRSVLRNILVPIYKLRGHLSGDAYREVLARCRQRIDGIRIDRTRVKPVVKIVGEFWAQTTESDGNYRMFDFLEKEGAQVQPEPLGTWITYLLMHARMQLAERRGLDSEYREPGSWDLRQRLSNEVGYQKKRALLSFGERLYERQYHRVVDLLGGTAHRLVPQEILAQLADPFYEPLARGGEGHLEVGKNIYYTMNKLCHMVLSLKPFGCMPSSQSDGIQSAVVDRFKDMLFLPIETSGEGQVNAQSRVQMALGEAKAKAKAEFQDALARSGRRVEEIREFVGRHSELQRPLYPVPHCAGVAGTAARFVLHVGDLMAGRARMQRA